MVVYTPLLVGEKDTVSLSSIGVIGRRRYFYYQRNEKRYPEVFQNDNFRTNSCPDSLKWQESMPYEKWMDGAELKLCRQVFGCCNDVVEESIVDLRQFHDFHPVFRWIAPEPELLKVRSLQGSAFIDFEVSKVEIRPDYRDNRRELNKIISTVDSLKSDADIQIDSIFIKGFASPESPYDNNTRLAKGRTLALKEYVTRLYSFAEDFIHTSFEPEDWDGLRRFVENSNIDNKDEILNIIKSDMEPDSREKKIKSTYPQTYRFLLETCYPALRHSDYRIVYNIKTYADIDELKKVFKDAPAKLSLREFFNLSSAYEPGTEEFSKVFEVATMVYPDNETANLNAANAAMVVGELDKAERYLAKAGKTAEAVYARAVHAALKQNYRQAKELFAEASSMPDNALVKDAALKSCEEMNDYIY